MGVTIKILLFNLRLYRTFLLVPSLFCQSSGIVITDGHEIKEKEGRKAAREALTAMVGRKSYK